MAPGNLVGQVEKLKTMASEPKKLYRLLLLLIIEYDPDEEKPPESEQLPLL